MLGWGLGPYLANHVVEPESINFRRWQDGTVIGHTKLIPDFRRSFDAPYLVVHRAHFHEALHHLALKLGVEVILDSTIKRYDAEEPAIDLANGDRHRADLVIAADGRCLRLRCGIRFDIKHRNQIFGTSSHLGGL